MRSYEILILAMTAIIFLLTLLMPKAIIERSQKKTDSKTEERNKAIRKSFQIKDTSNDSIDTIYKRTSKYRGSFRPKT